MASRDLYIGKQVDLAGGPLGEPYHLDADDLTTHGFVVGMTGSGKTGLSIVMIEELLRQGIPVVAIDPKGDLVNLALTFDRLSPEQFAPWVPPDESDDAAAVAGRWSAGLRDWGIEEDAVRDYAASRSIRIITPGSTAGRPLNVLNALKPSAPHGGHELETAREEIDSIVTGLLNFIDVDSDPVASRDYILLFNLVESAWREGRDLDLTSLVGLVANPPIEKVGALPMEAFYPARERNRLMMKLNNLVASPPFEAWRTGDPIDFDAWFAAGGSQTPLTIVYTAHLDDRERMFATSLLFTKLVSWMRGEPGRDSLRCLLYMDEVFGYFPPVANPPSKQPLLTLLKQARAYGVGVVLATQNPVDVDYKGLANIGFWAIGRLQTPQDRARVAGGIREALAAEGAPELEELLGRAEKRVFLVHNVHERAPVLVHSRWAVSYLRGPLTRDEIRRLSADAPAASGQPAVTSPGPATAVTGAEAGPVPAPTTIARPAPAVPGVRPAFVGRNGGTTATAYLWIKATVRYKAGRSNDPVERTVSVGYPISNLPNLGELFESAAVEIDESMMDSGGPDGLAYSDLPVEVMTAGLNAFDRVIRDRLDDALAIDVLYDPETKLWGLPGESDLDFARRIVDSPGERTRRSRLEERLSRKRSDLAIKSQEISGRRMEKWASIGTSILSNLTLITGRKRTVTGVGGVLSKSRMEGTARERKAHLEQEIADLEGQIAAMQDIDSSRFARKTVKPARADVSELRRELVWIY